MRIAFVYDTVYPDTKGGVEKRVWELARRLAQRGHEVHLLVPNTWKGPSRIQREGVILRGVCRSHELYTRRGRRSVLPAVAHGLGVLRVLRREHFDVVDCQIPAHLAALGAWYAARRKPDTNCIVSWHEAWDESWVEEMGILGHVGRRVEGAVARVPSRHMAISADTAAGLARLGRRVDAVITAGVDTEMIESVRAAGPPSDVLFIGRLVPTKNLGLLIESIGLLARRDIRPRVVVIGDGPYREHWEKLADRLGVGGQVEFIGTLDAWNEVIAALKSTRVLALPSLREGFGLVALEAAACGIPVVTVDHPRNAARNLVQSGVTGVCVPPVAEAFAAALEHVLRDDHWREALGREAVERARTATWDAAVDDTEALYRTRVVV
jgi:glycosyltransferase involved in cell wall biosynthesis